MRYYLRTCNLCGAERIGESYSNWTCSSCGQQYIYEEGDMLQLSEHQRNLLRADRGLPLVRLEAKP